MHEQAGPWFASILETVLRLLVAYDINQAGGVMLHSAALIRDSKAAVLFGHSGAGKSTASAIALQHGCRVISDDINILRPAASGWCVVPVPFSGTFNAVSDVFQPVPLSGLFRLLQSEQDRAQTMSLAHAVSVLAGSAPFINQDPGQSERLVDVVERLARKLAVRDLCFTRSPRFLEQIFSKSRSGDIHDG